MKFTIQTINKIAGEGLSRFPENAYSIADDIQDPDAILVRSASLHETAFSSRLKAIARAGAGVNNIPLDRCSEQGIVVFNTPGANANAVKELVIAGMLISSRKIVEGISWTRDLKGKGDEVKTMVEKGKANFAGPEIQGKTLGVVGLGAIGILVANAASALGMRVIGYDPYLTIDAAWQLSKEVQKARSLDALLGESDYITLHVPLLDSTKNFIDKSKFALMKDGVRILNFARGGLLHQADLFEALNQGKVGAFVTDFPDDEVLHHEKIIPVPHLGASTPESETNCAVMAVDQVRDYLENGNIKNSVNFPAADMARTGGSRIILAAKNAPAIVGKITSHLAACHYNIKDMLSQQKNDLSYNIIEIDGKVKEADIDAMRSFEGVIMTRLL
ncbi:MAG: 3-phosphoglycerate dehydrogenase family protein [Cyclobacteriaceae bacterium]|nr:3-phosphoglycerate dehydrogenase family protein [Cyclobacteriaceae bacterium]